MVDVRVVTRARMTSGCRAATVCSSHVWPLRSLMRLNLLPQLCRSSVDVHGCMPSRVDRGEASQSRMCYGISGKVLKRGKWVKRGNRCPRYGREFSNPPACPRVNSTQTHMHTRSWPHTRPHLCTQACHSSSMKWGMGPVKSEYVKMREAPMPLFHFRYRYHIG